MSEISVTAILEKPGVPTTLYAGTTDGLRITYDGGINWQPGPAELSGLTVQTLSVDPNDSRLVYVGTPGGVVRVKFP